MPGQPGARARDDVQVGRDLLHPSLGTITKAGFFGNVEVCVRYLAAWLDGNGCVPIHNLMEDAATAEIARAQLWQWLHFADAGRDRCTWTTAPRRFRAVRARFIAACPATSASQLRMPGASRINEARRCSTG
jgi:malate synthase